MHGHFRQSMAWLHTWCGLVCGWLLCAVFLTGTLSVFREPITRWMQARPVLQAAPVGDAATAAALAQAVRHLGRLAPDARFWRIELPQQPGDALLLAWRTARAAGQAALHPATGEPLPEPWGRATEGGRHFMSFHYMLQWDALGYWVVGGVSMGMLVALVSGVAVHRRIFQDFFTFRRGKGPRSWLDAHNLSAVLPLPFLFMIVYTGLAIFYTGYMPWPLQAVYGTDDAAFRRYQAELSHDGQAPLRRPRTGQPGALHDLAPLLRQAQRLTGQPPRMAVVEQPGDRNATVRVLGPRERASRTLRNPVSSVAFDGTTGAVLQVQSPEPAAARAGEQAHQAMEALHFARFGGWTMKWLYFFSGLLGTAMVASGLVLFAAKRRQKRGDAFGRATGAVYRAVEALNVAAVAGLCIACVGFLYANRLLPADLPGRAAWEIRAFLALWLLAPLHAACRPAERAWTEQLGAAALLCVALPLLNLATTGQQFVGYARAGDWQRAGVEIATVVFGLALAFAARQARRTRLRGHAPVRARSRAGAVAP